MPPVREIRTARDEALIEFSSPLAGLDLLGGERKLLTFGKSDLQSPGVVDGRIASLGFQRIGVEVFRQPDPLHPLGWVLGVRDLPRGPLVHDDGSPYIPGPHDTLVFGPDGFEGQDFGFYTATVGNAQIQNSTVIDGDWSGRFGYGGTNGSCQFLLYDQNGGLLTDEKELFGLGRLYLPSLPSGTNGVFNFTRTQGKASSFCIKSDGSAIIIEGVATEHDTGVNLSAATVYWFALWMRINSGTTGDMILVIWDGSGNSLGSVTVEDMDVNLSGTDGGSMGSHNVVTETFLDSVIVRTDAWPAGGKVSKRLYATAVGSEDEWNGGVTTNKHLEVDEVPPDDATTMVTSGPTAVDDLQTFKHGGGVSQGGMGASDTINAVSLWNRILMDDTIKRSKPRMRDASGNAQTPSVWDSSSGWHWGTQPMFRDAHPDGNPWSGKPMTDFDALEFGHAKFPSSFSDAKLSSCVVQAHHKPSGLTFDDPPAPPAPPGSLVLPDRSRRQALIGR